MSYGEIKWNKNAFQQKYDDLIYTLLHHIQMYERFDVIGKDIVHFLKLGEFTKEVARTPFDWDTFAKWEEK